MKARACRECHIITEADVCPSCGSMNLTGDWSGYVIIIDPMRSQIAKRLNVKIPGRYALKVR